VKKIYAGLLVLVILALTHAGQFSSIYSQEFGGTVRAELDPPASNNTSDPTTSFSLNIDPFYHFFPIDYVFVGPAVHYGLYYQLDKNKVNQGVVNDIGPGIDFGFAYPIMSYSVPFVQLNYTNYFGIYKDLSTNLTPGSSSVSRSDVNQLAFDVGLKIIVMSYVCISVTTGYTLAFHQYLPESGTAPAPVRAMAFRLINIGLSGLIY
jgi:hypothetical protein